MGKLVRIMDNNGITPLQGVQIRGDQFRLGILSSFKEAIQIYR